MTGVIVEESSLPKNLTRMERQEAKEQALKGSSYGRVVRSKKDNTVMEIIERAIINKLIEKDASRLFSDGSRRTGKELELINEFNSGIGIWDARFYMGERSSRRLV